VFTWSDGFHRYFVATTSRAKALAAWGFDRDLFREGAAGEVTEGAGHDAALARPGEVIEDSAGDIHRLVEEPAAKPKPKPSAKALAAAGKALEAAEAKLAALDDDRGAAEAGFEARARALADERAQAEARYDKTRADLQAKLQAARKALKDAGGRSSGS